MQTLTRGTVNTPVTAVIQAYEPASTRSRRPPGVVSTAVPTRSRRPPGVVSTAVPTRSRRPPAVVSTAVPTRSRQPAGVVSTAFPYTLRSPLARFALLAVPTRITASDEPRGGRGGAG